MDRHQCVIGEAQIMGGLRKQLTLHCGEFAFMVTGANGQRKPVTHTHSPVEDVVALHLGVGNVEHRTGHASKTQHGVDALLLVTGRCS